MRVENLAQGGRFGHGNEGAGPEHLPQIGLGEAVVGRLQFGNRGTLAAFQGIELRPAIAEEAVGVDQLHHFPRLAV